MLRSSARLLIGIMCVQALREKADDPAFQAEWQQMKQAAKVRALARISEATGVRLPEHAMLDVQVRFAQHSLARRPCCHPTVTHVGGAMPLTPQAEA